MCGELDREVSAIDKMLYSSGLTVKEIEKYTSVNSKILELIISNHISIEALSSQDYNNLLDFSRSIQREGYTHFQRRNDNGSRKSRLPYIRLSDNQKQILKDKGIDIETYYRRRKRGWSFEKIINTPVRKKVFMTEEEKAIIQKNGIDPRTFHSRISRG